MKPKTLKYFEKSAIIEEIREVIENINRITEPDKNITVKELRKSTVDLLGYFICQVENDGECPDEKPEIADDTPYERIMIMWNDICTAHNPLKGVSKTRKKHIRARWKEMPDIFEWSELFCKIQECKFLREWKGFDFNWFISRAGNFEKLREGKYWEGGNGRNGTSDAKTGKAKKLNSFENTTGRGKRT
jgi:hypothetical protein